MTTQPKKNTALFLILGVFLMVVTMVLHPTGGSFERLLANADIGIVAHSLAILSVPFSALGFLGLTQILGQQRFFTRLAFAIMTIGLLAAMLAATLNGLALPLFVKKYADASPETIEAIRPIFHYNMALNHGFDYILIAAMFLSTVLWSIPIIRTKTLPAWIGYFGILLVAAFLTALLLGFFFLDLYGFRIFIFGWVAWIAVTAFRLPRAKKLR